MDRDDCLDDGLKWRGRVSEDSDTEDDELALYAERTRGRFDEFVSRVGGLGGSDSDEDEDEDEDEDDPLGGLVTIGTLDAPGSLADASDGEPSRSAASDDFMKQLEEMIERDMPKVKITDEYQKVLDAVDASEGGLIGDEDGKEALETNRKPKAGGEGHQERQECEAGNGATYNRDASHDSTLLEDDEGDDSLPDLGAVLGGGRKDRDVEELEGLVAELAVDEGVEREKRLRGTFFDEDGIVDIGDDRGGEGDVLDGI